MEDIRGQNVICRFGESQRSLDLFQGLNCSHLSPTEKKTTVGRQVDGKAAVVCVPCRSKQVPLSHLCRCSGVPLAGRAAKYQLW